MIVFKESCSMYYYMSLPLLASWYTCTLPSSTPKRLRKKMTKQQLISLFKVETKKWIFKKTTHNQIYV